MELKKEEKKDLVIRDLTSCCKVDLMKVSAPVLGIDVCVFAGTEEQRNYLMGDSMA